MNKHLEFRNQKQKEVLLDVKLACFLQWCVGLCHVQIPAGFLAPCSEAPVLVMEG